MGEHPPPGAQHALEVYISRLRKTLDPAGERQVVLTSPGAYLLCASADSVVIRRFERLAEEGRSALAQNAPDRAAADLREALGLWRGAPLADVSYEQFAQPEIARLNELRMGITEDRIEADLALGRHAGAVSELGALVAAHPLRERLYQLLMIALYPCGRQSEALAVYQSARGLTGPAGDLFRADISEVVATRLNREATLLVIESWTPQRGLRVVERECRGTPSKPARPAAYTLSQEKR